MANPPRQFGSVFELQFPQSVGIYSSYEDAQKAVDFLADSKFEVQNLAIVGTDLKSVERVLGRRNWGTVITQGLQSGISTGLLVGLVVLIFTRPSSTDTCVPFGRSYTLNCVPMACTMTVLV